MCIEQFLHVFHCSHDNINYNKEFNNNNDILCIYNKLHIPLYHPKKQLCHNYVIIIRTPLGKIYINEYTNNYEIIT